MSHSVLRVTKIGVVFSTFSPRRTNKMSLNLKTAQDCFKPRKDILL